MGVLTKAQQTEVNAFYAETNESLRNIMCDALGLRCRFETVLESLPPIVHKHICGTPDDVIDHLDEVVELVAVILVEIEVTRGRRK